MSAAFKPGVLGVIELDAISTVIHAVDKNASIIVVEDNPPTVIVSTKIGLRIYELRNGKWELTGL